MKIKYENIEWESDGEEKSHKVDKVFWLAVIPKPNNGCSESYKSYRGINIGISIPHKSQSEGEEFEKALFGSKQYKDKGYIECYLVGQGVRIPVMIGEGNSYNEKMGTSCLFGYFSPDWLAGDERPKINKFGATNIEKIQLLDAKFADHYDESCLYLVSLRYPDGEELIDVEFSGTDVAVNLSCKAWEDANGVWTSLMRR